MFNDQKCRTKITKQTEKKLMIPADINNLSDDGWATAAKKFSNPFFW